MNCLSGKLHTAVRAFTPSFGRLAAQASRLEGGRTLQTAGAGDFARRITERAVRRAPDGWQRFSMVDLEESAQETSGQQVHSRSFPPVNIRMLFQLYGAGYEPSAFYLRRMEQLLERRAAQADRELPPDEARRERLESRSVNRAVYPQTAAEAGLRKLPAAQKAWPDSPRTAEYPAEYPPLARTLRQPAGLIEWTYAPHRQTAWTRPLAAVADSTLLYKEKAPSEGQGQQRRFTWTPVRMVRTAFRTERSAPGEGQAGRETAGLVQRYAAGGRSGSSWSGRLDAWAPQSELYPMAMPVGGTLALRLGINMDGISGGNGFPFQTLALAPAAVLPPPNPSRHLERIFGIAGTQKSLSGGMLRPGRASALFAPAWANFYALNGQGQRYPALLFEQPAQAQGLSERTDASVRPMEGRRNQTVSPRGSYALLQQLLLAGIPKLLSPPSARMKTSGQDAAAFIQAANAHRPHPIPTQMGWTRQTAQAKDAYVRYSSVFAVQAGWGAAFAQNANPHRLSAAAPRSRGAGESAGMQSRLPGTVYSAKAAAPVLLSNMTGTQPFEQAQNTAASATGIPDFEQMWRIPSLDGGPQTDIQGKMRTPAVLTARPDSPFDRRIHSVMLRSGAERVLSGRKRGSSGLSGGWRHRRDPERLIDREEAPAPVGMDLPSAVEGPRSAGSTAGFTQVLSMDLTRLLNRLGRTPSTARPTHGGFFGRGTDRRGRPAPHTQWMPWTWRPAHRESASGQTVPALSVREADLAVPPVQLRYGTYTDGAGRNAFERTESRWLSVRYSDEAVSWAAALFYRLLSKRLERLTNVPEGSEPQARRSPAAGKRGWGARRVHKRPGARALPDTRRAPVRIRLSERLTKLVEGALPGQETTVESTAGTRRIALLAGRAPQTPATLMELLSGPSREDGRIFSAAELVLYAPEAADGGGPRLGGEHWPPFGGQPAGRVIRTDARERRDGRPQAAIDGSRAQSSDRGWDELHASRSLRQNRGLLMQARGGLARMSARLAGQAPDLAGAIERRGRIALLTLEQQRAEQTPLSLEMALSGRQGPMRQVFNPSEIVMLNPPSYLGRFGEGSARPVGRQDWKKVGWSDAPHGAFTAGGRDAAEAQPDGPLPAQLSGEQARKAQSFFRARAELARREREAGGIAPAGVPPRLMMPDIAYKERGTDAAGRLPSQTEGQPRSLNTSVRTTRETQVIRQSGQVSDAELSRMADQIYRKLESRISAERRRFGL
ncbi:hypothetical protein [Anaerotruncus colihominis]|uniref:hypothetical protein n=1 Tax=Anaerotruncus colihominis TaxID=169435 RepID=UPI002942E68F|nr:hypothetical protein [Anaerotruncus colihominis]